MFVLGYGNCQKTVLEEGGHDLNMARLVRIFDVSEVTVYLLFPVDPFQWMYLPVAKVPFSDSIVFQVLAKLESEDFVQSLVDDLRREFKVSIGGGFLVFFF